MTRRKMVDGRRRAVSPWRSRSWAPVPSWHRRRRRDRGGGTSFLDRVAQKLGIESSTLQNAVNSAANDQIDEQVQNGDLTQQQADKLKQRIANGQGPWFNGPGGLGRVAAAMGMRLRRSDSACWALTQTKLADFLGISTDQLKTELQAQGATLATVASSPRQDAR